MAFAQAQELRPHGATAVSLTPGWMRSEIMLEAYGVTEASWRDAAGGNAGTEDLSAVPEVVVRFAAEQVGVDPVDVVMEDAEEV
jgi:hypothetical protein